MPDYKLYRMGDDGHIKARVDIEARDDLDALEQAQKICGPDEIEVWEGARFITRVTADGNASIAPRPEHSPGPG